MAFTPGLTLGASLPGAIVEDETRKREQAMASVPQIPVPAPGAQPPVEGQSPTPAPQEGTQQLPAAPPVTQADTRAANYGAFQIMQQAGNVQAVEGEKKIEASEQYAGATRNILEDFVKVTDSTVKTIAPIADATVQDSIHLQEANQRGDLGNLFMYVFSGFNSKYSPTALTERIQGNQQVMAALKQRQAMEMEVIQSRLTAAQQLYNVESTVSGNRIEAATTTMTTAKGLAEHLRQSALQDQQMIKNDLEINAAKEEQSLGFIPAEFLGQAEKQAAQAEARGQKWLGPDGFAVSSSAIRKRRLEDQQTVATLTKMNIDIQKGRMDIANQEELDLINSLPPGIALNMAQNGGVWTNPDGTPRVDANGNIMRVTNQRALAEHIGQSFSALNTGMENQGKLNDRQVRVMADSQALLNIANQWGAEFMTPGAPSMRFPKGTPPKFQQTAFAMREYLSAVMDPKSGKIDPQKVMAYQGDLPGKLLQSLTDDATDWNSKLYSNKAAASVATAQALSVPPSQGDALEVVTGAALVPSIGGLSPVAPGAVAWSAFSKSYNGTVQQILADSGAGIDWSNWSKMTQEERNTALSEADKKSPGLKQAIMAATTPALQAAQRVYASQINDRMLRTAYEKSQLQQRTGLTWEQLDRDVVARAETVAAKETGLSKEAFEALSAQKTRDATQEKAVRDYKAVSVAAYNTELANRLMPYRYYSERGNPDKGTESGWSYFSRFLTPQTAAEAVAAADAELRAANVEGFALSNLMDPQGTVQASVEVNRQSYLRIADLHKLEANRQAAQIAKDWKNPAKKTEATLRVLGVMGALSPEEAAAFQIQLNKHDPKITAQFPAAVIQVAEQYVQDPKQMAKIRDKASKGWQQAEQIAHIVAQSILDNPSQDPPMPAFLDAPPAPPIDSNEGALDVLTNPFTFTYGARPE